MYSLKGKKVLIAGSGGMVGSAVLQELLQEECLEIFSPRRESLDLLCKESVEEWFKDKKPDVVIDCAAKVGGILGNSKYPVEFLTENLTIQDNLINSSALIGVDKFIFLGSSCIYPKYSKQPIKEEYLLSGELEKTNEAYALAKICGIKLCQYYNQQYGTNYISLMPTNLYGPGDNFNLENSHVIPALIIKAHNAKKRNNKKIEIWGTGRPHREFLHVEDLAKAIIFCTQNYSSSEPINIGYGEDISIKDLACTIRDIIYPGAEIQFNSDYPDGTPKKLLNSSKIFNCGWKPKISLEDGIKNTYQWFLENEKVIRK